MKISDNNKEIVHIESEYSLRARIDQAHLHIQIYMMSPPRVYAINLYNGNLPQHLQSCLPQVKMIFECLKLPFTIIQQQDGKSVELKIKAEIVQKIKKIQKQVSILLKLEEISQHELICRKMCYIRQDVHQIADTNRNMLEKSVQILQHNRKRSMEQQNIGLQQQMQQQNISPHKNIKNMRDMKQLKQHITQTNQKINKAFEDIMQIFNKGKLKLRSFDQIIENNKNLINKLKTGKYGYLYDQPGVVQINQDISMHQVDEFSCRRPVELGFDNHLQYYEQISKDGYAQQQNIYQSYKPLPFNVQLQLQHQQLRIPPPQPPINRQPQPQPQPQAPKPPKKPLQLMPKRGPQKFTLKSNILTHLASQKRNQAVINYKMKINKHHQSYKVKILKQYHNNIYLGIVSLQSSRNHFTNDAICYCSEGGQIWDRAPCKEDGVGFGTGSIVEVKIRKGEISWTVDGTSTTTHKTYQLNDPNTLFLPFVQMAYLYDSLQFLV